MLFSINLMTRPVDQALWIPVAHDFYQFVHSYIHMYFAFHSVEFRSSMPWTMECYTNGLMQMHWSYCSLAQNPPYSSTYIVGWHSACCPAQYSVMDSPLYVGGSHAYITITRLPAAGHNTGTIICKKKVLPDHIFNWWDHLQIWLASPPHYKRDI